MSDFGEYFIIDFETDISYIKEIIDILLNIIFFHRYLNNNNYIDVQSKLYNISYIKIKDEILENKIHDIISKIETNYKNNMNEYGIKLTLQFFEKKKKDNKPWEIWKFILIVSKKEEIKEDNKIEDNSDIIGNKLREITFNIIEKLNDKNNYMPNINIQDKSLGNQIFPFDYEIEKIAKKEDYLSHFNDFIKKNQENVIIINGIP